MKLRHLSIAYTSMYRFSELLSCAFHLQSIAILTIDDVIGDSTCIIAPNRHPIGSSLTEHYSCTFRLGGEKEKVRIFNYRNILSILLGDIFVEESMVDDVFLVAMFSGKISDATNMKFSINTFSP